MTLIDFFEEHQVTIFAFIYGLALGVIIMDIAYFAG